MNTFDKIEDMLCEELDQIAIKKELTSNALEVMDKAVDIIKDIRTIEAMEEAGYNDDGYSNRMPDYMYNDGMSYARSRGRYAKRDSMGRYSRDSYERGYSREGVKDHLERMMNEAKTEQEREMIRKWMNEA